MSAAASIDEAPRLVDLLLAEQQTLRAVDEFSALHDAGAFDAQRFETLIPMQAPGPGQQFAFAVDLDRCTGCKACVTACHSLNGLDFGETWRSVGVLESAAARPDDEILQQSVTTACHHCESPGCLEGCPVQAYVKDPITGIVRHLDDQCIGCRYCQLMCPYDVPKFNERLGIVRKCDMCHGRLAAGEAPACVQGCPTQAISIEIVDQGRAAEPMLLPIVEGGMPSSGLTRPTTRYRTERAIPADLRAVDPPAVEASEAHEPLALMLVLTQASIGAFAVEALLSAWDASTATAGVAGLSGQGEVTCLTTLGLAALLGLAGLGASTAHLGRPLWAFRAFLGVRTSWMSREILVLGAFATTMLAAVATTFATVLGPAGSRGWLDSLAAANRPLLALALAFGFAGLFCSMKIYSATGRPFWRLDRTALRFAGTAAVVGTAIVSFAASLQGLVGAGASGSDVGLTPWLPAAVACLVALKLRLESHRLVQGEPGMDESALARTRELLAGSLARSLRWRVGFGIVFGVALPLLQILGIALGFGPLPLVALSAASLIGCLVGEALERSLFFRGEAMRAMPGMQ
jgi:Fe-S-cluster-containing dehydrogenase component/DMSO reductase anchor subunit